MRRRQSRSDAIFVAVVVRVFQLALLVFAVFLLLKLASVGMVANWSWWSVTSPLWGAAITAVVVIAGAFVWDAYRWLARKLRSRKAGVRTTR